MHVLFAFIITPLAAFASLLYLENTNEFLLNLFITIGLAGLGLLIGVGTTKISRLFFKWKTHYIRSNLNYIKGESGQNLQFLGDGR
ncbi:DUF1700 domain-containing protein [Bacillus sp. IB182487]|uniref:DUF1700 domain-containing protein n=1 Tax=Metabacillus arenae TaxID=2771434 RepID=A0A926S2Z7_9BACI|nr:DUF1700 domain-containing protein [Metabacillus arenae]